MKLRTTRRALVVALCLLGLPAVAYAAVDPDGSYQGRFQDVEDPDDRGTVRLTVARDGRSITRFRASPLAVCVNPNAIGGIEVVPVAVAFDRIAVRRDGRFRARETFSADPPSDAKQTWEVSGRLRGRRIVNGRLTLSERCASKETFSARRRAR